MSEPSANFGLITAVIGLVGVVIGGLVGTLGQYLLQRWDRKHLAKQVARGLAGEIQALIDIVTFRRYSETLRDDARRMRSGEPIAPSIAVSQHYFAVFESNTDKLGLLDGSLPEQVAMLYVRAKSIIEDFASMLTPGFRAQAGDERADLCEHTAQLIDETMVLASGLVIALRSFADS